MAIKKFLFMDGTYGYQHEQESTDGLKLPSLVLGAGSESAGNIQMSGTGKVIGLANGTDAADAINKSQLDAAIAGYEWQAPVSVLKMKSDVARTPTGAIIEGSGGTGIVNLTTGNAFTVAIDGETPVVVTLASAPADVAAAIAAINSLYAAGGGTGGTIAVDGGGGQIDIKSNTTGTGSSVALTSVHANWAEVGITAGTDAGTNDLPTAGAAGEAWVVNGWGTGYNNGDIVEWDGSTWNVVLSNSGGEPPNATRVAVISASAAGSFAAHENTIGTYNATTDTWSFLAATDGDAVLVSGENSVYENIGFVYDTGSSWVAFTGPASIPDATGASGGGIKGKATFDTDKGLAVASGVVSAKLAAAGSGTGGLEFNGSGAMQLDLDASGALDLSASGLAVKVDGSTITINGSNQLTAAVAESERTEKDYAVGEAIAKGDPVYFSANDTVSKADAGNETKARTVGIARIAIPSGSGPVCFSGLVTGVLTTATVNTPYYLASGGGLTATRPTGNVRIIRIGYAASASDLLVQITDFGRGVAA
jgi:hypothetical protein